VETRQKVELEIRINSTPCFIGFNASGEAADLPQAACFRSNNRYIRKAQFRFRSQLACAPGCGRFQYVSKPDGHVRMRAELRSGRTLKKEQIANKYLLVSTRNSARMS
jgi:hypothetical protein